MKLNTERLMRGIFKEFKNMDNFRSCFKNDFYEAFHRLIEDLYPIPENDELVDYIQMRAEEAMWLADSVIEKDRTYPEYRQEMELRNLNVLLEKQHIKKAHSKKFEQVKFELNALLLKHYPAIFELSSFGYRLLDRNVKNFAYQFTTAMEEKVSNRPYYR